MVTTAGKYARRELERRFLLDAVPSGEPVATTTIVDRYIHGTRLRLRAMAHDGRTVCKLTQKADGLITTIYLDTAEYQVFAVLPADVIEKTRLHFPPLAVDVVEPDLVIGEVEFDSEDKMARYVPPTSAVREITGDPDLTGAALAARLSPGRPRPPHRAAQ